MAPTHRLRWLVVPALAVLAHCSSSSGGEGPAASDGGADGAVDGGVLPDAGGLPDASPKDGGVLALDAPKAITFRDRDPRAGFAEGTITVERAVDESRLSGYRVYWTDPSGAQLGTVGSLPKSTAPLALSLAAGTVTPKGATLLAAVGTSASSSSTAVTTKGDNFPVFADLGANAGSDYLLYAHTLVDPANKKLLVVGQDWSRRLTLRRCALDGTTCTAAVVEAGRGGETGWFPSATIDTASKKLLIASQDTSNGNRASLFRCELDGTACVWTDVSAGQGAGSGHTPVVLVDDVAKKVLVVADNWAGATLGLSRCDLDGTHCAYTDLAAGQPQYTIQQPAAVIDKANGKLLVVTRGQQGKSTLARCATDGSGCTYADVSAGGAKNSGGSPSIAIDTVNAKLQIVTQDDSNNASLQHLAFVRCDIDGSACTGAELGGASTGAAPQVLVHATEMLVLGTEPLGPTLRRCALDGTGCAVTSLSTPGDGVGVNGALDATTDTLLVAATSSPGVPVLYRYAFDGSPIVRRDLSAGPGSRTGFAPSAVQDLASGALLVATSAQVLDVPRVLLFRCGADGSACSYADLSAGNDRHPAGPVTLLQDTAGKKVMVVFNEAANSNRPAMLRCNPDGTACFYADLSGGAAASTGTNAVAAVDAANGKLLIVGAGSGNGGRPALFRCGLDGSGCTFTDLVPGGGLIEAPRSLLLSGGKLTFVVSGPLSPTWVQCALDGTACSWHTLPVDRPTPVGVPYATVDEANAKLVVVAQSGTGPATGFGPALYRCALDGTACATFADVSTGLPAVGGNPTVTVDTVAKKLLIVISDNAGAIDTTYPWQRPGPSLYRCELDGSACTYVDLAAGQGRLSGANPVPIFDAARNRLLVVTDDAANLERPGLFMLDGW